MSGPEAQDTDTVPDRGPAVFAVTTATLALATLFVAARVVSRAGILRRTGWDDYVVVLAWLLAVFLSLSINLGAKRGLGRHDRDIDPGSRAELRRCEYVFSVLYNPALMATKTSILIFYLRLSKNTQKILRLASWAVLGIVNVAGATLTFMNIFQCEPARAAWDINVEPMRCIPLLTEFICSAPVNVATDLAILALPIPVLTSMRLPPRQKTILVMTFALGIFVTVVDVVRIYYLQQAIDRVPTGASSDPMATYGENAGFSWNASLSLMWSAVEVNVGIICACIPTLKPLIIRILPAMLIDPDGTLRSSTWATGSRSSKDARWASPVIAPDSIPNQPRPGPARSLTPPDEQERLPSDEISIRDFLSNTAPSTTQQPPTNTTITATGPLLTDRGSKIGTSFTFVNLNNPKSMLQISTGRESLRHCTPVTVLFFLWGFSYGLLHTLNDAVASVAGMSVPQTIGLTSIYWGGGYLAGPWLVGGWLLRHEEHHRFRHRHRGHTYRHKQRCNREGYEGKKEKQEEEKSVGGFKATFIAGLLIYGAGTIMFWPGAVLAAYGGFMISSFVVGFGLAVLETAANPFLALCGPPEYAEARLLLAQGVQAVGSVLSGLLADRVFFLQLEVNSATLIDVQWTYLAVTLLSVLLALAFYYTPLPEVGDAELAEVAARLPVDPKRKSVGGVSLRTWAIGLAVLAQFCYVSAQENMSVFFQPLVMAFVNTANTSSSGGLAMSLPNYLLLSHSVFALSRFLTGGLCYLSARFSSAPLLPAPRTILALCIALSTLLVLIAITLPVSSVSNPNLAAIPIVLFYFAEGPIWPLVFSLGLRGQGERTKSAAAWLTMAGCGPGVWPFVSYGILHGGGSVQVAMVVVVVLMAVAGVYPLFLGWVKGAKELVSTSPRARDRDGEGDGSGGKGAVESGVEGERRVSGTSGDDRRVTDDGGFLEQRLSPGCPGTGVSQSPIVGSDRSSNEQSQQAPWENQVLDTRMLQD